MTGPLYERFSTQQGTYVYDTYSNQILSASPATATILDDVLLSRLEPERLAASHADITADNIAAAVKDIEAAVSTGHFGACNVSQMGFYQDDATLLHRIRGAVSHLTLELTERCNFRCRYCPQTYDPARQTSRADMPMRTLRKRSDVSQRGPASPWSEPSHSGAESHWFGSTSFRRPSNSSGATIRSCIRRIRSRRMPP